MFATIDPLAVLELVAENGLTLERIGHRLYLGPPPVPAFIKELVGAHRDLVFAVLMSTQTGHVWARCDQCGEGLMRPKGAAPRRCVFTPGCQGSHRP